MLFTFHQKHVIGAIDDGWDYIQVEHRRIRKTLVNKINPQTIFGQGRFQGIYYLYGFKIGVSLFDLTL